MAGPEKCKGERGKWVFPDGEEVVRKIDLQNVQLPDTEPKAGPVKQIETTIMRLKERTEVLQVERDKLKAVIEADDILDKLWRLEHKNSDLFTRAWIAEKKNEVFHKVIGEAIMFLQKLVAQYELGSALDIPGYIGRVVAKLEVVRDKK